MMDEQKKYYSLDRLEDGFAVLLDDEGEALTLPLDALALPGPSLSQEDAPQPADKRPVREGDILVQVNGRWLRDDAETARRRKRNAALLANLRRRSALK